MSAASDVIQGSGPVENIPRSKVKKYGDFQAAREIT
jgi:hypothetical protein